MIYDGGCSKCDPGWLLNKLFEAKELIETANVLRIILSRLVCCSFCEITVCVSKKDNFFTLLVQIGDNFFHFIEGTNRIT